MSEIPKRPLTLTINGATQTLSAHPMARLLDVLREEAQLYGTKEGCGEGECGACSVFIDGKLVNSCLVPAAQAHGKRIETIEGVGTAGELSSVQRAFLKCGGAQCGICTPGMVMATISLLRENPQPSVDDAREALAGNLCRCTGYMRIFEAVREAAQSPERSAKVSGAQP